MEIKNKTKSCILLIIGIIIINIGLFSAADIFAGGNAPASFSGENYRIYGSVVNPQFSQPGYYAGVNPADYWSNFDRQDCQERQDVILTIPPGGCSPAVVRSDLLEEQDVPVFCKISSIQVNPLIDITKIKGIHFTGDFGDKIAGISYYPAQAAISGYDKVVGSPVVDNLGYIIVKLRRTEAERDMPDFVDVNVTAVIDYNAEGVFGVGEQEFFLTETDDQVWENTYKDNGFWKGKGFIRAESISDDSARISIYKDATNLETSVEVGKGETSRDLYLGGYYCAAGLNVRVTDINYPVKKALISFDDEKTWVIEGSKFLDGKCSVTRIIPDLVGGGNVDFVCGSNKFSLSLSGRKFTFDVEGKEVQAVVGDKITSKDIGNGTRDIYFVYNGKYPDSKNEFSVLVAIPQGGDATIFNGMGVKINSAIQAWKHRGLVGTIKDNTIEIVLRLFHKFYEDGVVYSSSGEYSPDETEFYKFLAGKLESAYPILSEANSNYAKILVGPATWDAYGVTINGIVYGESVLGEDTLLGNSYDTAVSSYQDTADFYPNEKQVVGDAQNNLDYYGEEALYNAGVLSGQLGLLEDQRKYFEELIEKYPESSKANDAQTQLNNIYFGLKNAQAIVYINNQPHFISLYSLEEPSFDDLGAEVLLMVNGKEEPLELEKNIPQKMPGTDYYIEVTDIKDGEVTIKYDTELNTKQTIVDFALKNIVGSGGLKQTSTLTIGQEIILSNSVTARLMDTNLNKQVQVKITPKIFGTRTESDIHFRIGIEKRAIKLSPEKTQEMIDNLGESIKKWDDINNKLGNVVEGMKGVCYATSAILMAKTFVSGMSGKSMARTDVMSGENGWNSLCKDAVAEGKGIDVCGGGIPSNVANCLLDCNDAIEASVDKLGKLYDDENNVLKGLAGTPEKSDALDLQGSVNSTKVKQAYCDEYIKGKTFSDISSVDLQGVGKKALIGEKDAIYTPKQINDCDLDLEEMKLLNLREQVSDDPFLSKLIDGKMSTDLVSTYKINDITRNEGILKDKAKDVATFSGLSQNLFYQEMSDASVAPPTVKDKLGSGKTFTDYINGTPVIFGLVKTAGDKYSVKSVYNLNNGADMTSQPYTQDGKGNAVPYSEYYSYNYNIKEFTMASEDSYKTPIKEDVKVEVHDRAPYTNLPSFVPIGKVGTTDGWYVSTDYVLSGFGKPFEESGRAINFWICNVGTNGIVNYKQGDECRYYNLGSSAELGFPGLSPSQSTKVVQAAQSALQQASEQLAQGKTKVTINGKVYGTTVAADSTTGECTDFMSPKDCNLMFNVCDPVICPASRCDFGGQFRVSDVVQSGIIGSLVLCLPNANEGIYVPICLSGVHAGIEGYLSILKSTQACLNESLVTGKNIGICDEIKSIYLCEFFWKQATPLIEVAIPRMFESIFGQGARGGGEYLTIDKAFENTKNAIDYFKNEYAVNSMKAFNSRSTEDVGGEVCKSFVSAQYPANKNFFDNLLEPDSPVQYSAWFSESTLTTATVPATSQYKVYYHIYAGKDIGSNYVVYLKNPPESNYVYTVGSYTVARGYIERGQQVDETRDFTGVSGYTQLCVNINGQEECGFKQVSTSFALDYLSTQYAKDQIESDITTSTQCVSGTVGQYNIANPNLQAGVEESITPEIYKRGIIRVCATDNPGLQVLDSGNTVDRWQRVGYCDDKTIGCWIDTQSVEAVLSLDKTATNQSLDYIEDKYKQYLLEANITYVFTEDQSRTILEKAKSIYVKLNKNLITSDRLTQDNVNLELGEIEKSLDDLSQKGPTQGYQAQALLWKGKIFDLITSKTYQLKVLGKKDVAVSEYEKECNFYGGEILTGTEADSCIANGCKIITSEISSFGGVCCDSSCLSANGITASSDSKTNTLSGYSISTDNILFGGQETGLYLTKVDNGYQIKQKKSLMGVDDLWADKLVGVITKGKIIFTTDSKTHEMMELEGYTFDGTNFNSINSGPTELTPLTRAELLTQAIDEVSKLDGSYSKNKVFVDGLYEDGLLTTAQYNEINGEGTLNLEENMAYVKNLLLQKKIEGVADAQIVKLSPRVLDGELYVDVIIQNIDKPLNYQVRLYDSKNERIGMSSVEILLTENQLKTVKVSTAGSIDSINNIGDYCYVSLYIVGDNERRVDHKTIWINRGEIVDARERTGTGFTTNDELYVGVTINNTGVKENSYRLQLLNENGKEIGQSFSSKLSSGKKEYIEVSTNGRSYDVNDIGSKYTVKLYIEGETDALVSKTYSFDSTKLTSTAKVAQEL